MSSKHHIGMLGPATLADFKEFLHPSVWREDLPVGQLGTPVSILGRELLSRGLRLTVFTLDQGTEKELILDGPHLRICVIPARPANQGPARDFFAFERRGLVGAVLRERPDILHAQWTYHYALAAQASDLPYVVTAHDAPISVLRRSFIPHRIAHTLMAYVVLARARRVVSVSPYVAKHLQRFMLYRGSPEVIPNGLPDQIFGLRGDRPFDRNSVTFASVLTGWDNLKNGPAVIEAFAIVRAVHPRARLLLMGYGHEAGGPADRWARDRKLHEGIEFVGQIPHFDALRRLAAEADIYVHPSREEACSMAIAEALALGLPAIGGRRSGGVPYSLDEGRAGLLVDLAPASLAKAMLRLADDDAERRRLGAAGRAYAMNRFQIRNVADRYLALYDEAVHASASG